jgi:hypothetical protein
VTTVELVVVRGGDYATWDIEARAGLLAGVSAVTTVEEHGRGRQLLRFRVRPRPATLTSALLVVLLGAGIAAAIASAWAAAAVLGVLCALVAGRAVATAAVRCATRPEEREATSGQLALVDAQAEGRST